jgi:hypothetical protein
VFAAAQGYPELGSATLAEALALRGGPGVDGAVQILLRAAVASALNAAHPDVLYPRTLAEVIADVDAALLSGNRETILQLAASLDEDNNLGCPLGGSPASPAGNDCSGPELAASFDFIDLECGSMEGRDFRRCMRSVFKQARREDVLTRACRRDASRCARRSTSTRPGWVVCQQQRANGKTTCSLKRTAERCRVPRGGAACVFPEAWSCCDAGLTCP